MKIDTSSYLETNFDTSNLQNFGIDLSGKAYDILSSDIYTDAPLAVLRELSCNAWDSHVEAGTTDTPFEVWLPSSSATDLIIKDYGVGLSHKAVMTLYSIYFLSNKTHTDELIGGMGLGSKTPFAYTDQFTVKSTYEGVERTYACMKNAKGVPGILPVSSKPSTEHSGMEIIIPAKSGDFDSSLYCLQWFPTPPKLMGNTIPQENWVHRTTTYGVTKGGYRGYYNHARVVMGHVSYKTDVTAFKNTKYQLYLFVPINTYPFQVSRERLKEKLPDLESRVNAAARAYRAYVMEHSKTLSNFEQFKFLKENQELVSSEYQSKLREYHSHFKFADRTKKNKFAWNKRESKYNQIMFECKFIHAEPGTLYNKIANEYFPHYELMLVKEKDTERVRDWFDDIILSSDYKVIKAKRTPGSSSLYKGIYLKKQAVGKEMIGTDHPVEFYRRIDGTGMNQWIKYIDKYEAGVLFVPSTKPLKEKFKDHLSPLEWLKKLLVARHPELTEYDYNIKQKMPHLNIFCDYKYSRACIEMKKIRNATRKLQRYQELIHLHPDKHYPYNRLFKLYLRMMNRYSYEAFHYYNPHQFLRNQDELHTHRT